MAKRRKSGANKSRKGKADFADYALAKIHKEPLHGLASLLLETGQFEFVDRHYQFRFEQAKSAKEKRQVLIEYGEKYPGHTSNSSWYGKVIPPLTLRSRTTRSSPPRPNALKAFIAEIKASNPKISQKAICRALDNQEVALPKIWRLGQVSTWIDALEDTDLNGRLKTYLSKIKSATRN